MEDPKKKLEHFQHGVARLAAEIPETIGALLGFVKTAQSESALTVREKELIAVGISLYHRCGECIVVHVDAALRAGCTRREIIEAAGMAMVFGGGPSLGSSATLLLDALDAFEVPAGAEVAEA